MKVALAYLTKDRVDLTKQTMIAAFEGHHDLFWIDGSETLEGQQALEGTSFHATS